MRIPKAAVVAALQVLPAAVAQDLEAMRTPKAAAAAAVCLAVYLVAEWVGPVLPAAAQDPADSNQELISLRMSW